MTRDELQNLLNNLGYQFIRSETTGFRAIDRYQRNNQVIYIGKHYIETDFGNLPYRESSDEEINNFLEELLKNE